MIRLMGAILVAVGCMWMGEFKVRKLRERVIILEDISSALEELSQELELRTPALSDLMEQIAHHRETPVGQLFRDCCLYLKNLGDEPFEVFWCRRVDQVTQLQPEERRSLKSLGYVLGKYSGHEQSLAIRSVQRELTGIRGVAREEWRRLGRVYRAVGAAGGGALVILLL